MALEAETNDVDDAGNPKTGTKNAHHREKIKLNIVNRLNKIEGQIRGLARMVREDVYCDDVLNQITSVEAAMNGVRKQLLEAHIKSCVVDQIERGQYEVIDELIKTIAKVIR